MFLGSLRRWLVRENLANSGTPLGTAYYQLIGAKPLERESTITPLPSALSLRRFSLGKSEMELIGFWLLNVSVANKAKTWEAVPWPRLADLASNLSIKRSFALDGSMEKLVQHMENFKRVPPMPSDETHVHQTIDDHLMETTRTNGLPNVIVVGVRLLEKDGYVTIEDNGELDLVMPTQKLIDAALPARPQPVKPA